MQPKAKIKNFKFNQYPIPLKTVKRFTRLNSRQIELNGRYRLLQWMTNALVWVCLKLSWKAAFDLGTALGLLLYHLRVRRHVAMVNLRIVYGNKKCQQELEQIYKNAMINVGRLVFNYIRLPYQPPEFWEKKVHKVNFDLLISALKHGRGAIALAAHLGVIDLAAGGLGQTGYPVAVVGKRVKSPFWDQFVLNARLAMNVGTIRHRNSMKRILKGLKSGEVIVMALDQNMRRKQGKFLNWMGRPASSVYASGYLAQKLNIPILVGYCYQKGPEDFELVFTEQVPWRSHPTNKKQEALINAQSHADAVQRMILNHPDIWFWIHKRWRIQPNEADDPYK